MLGWAGMDLQLILSCGLLAGCASFVAVQIGGPFLKRRSHRRRTLWPYKS